MDSVKLAQATAMFVTTILISVPLCAKLTLTVNLAMAARLTNSAMLAHSNVRHVMLIPTLVMMFCTVIHATMGMKKTKMFVPNVQATV